MMSKVKDALGGHSEGRAHLRITIVNVRDLGSKDLASKTDPYLSLKVGHQKKKTTVKKGAGGVNVDINETFDFDVHPDDTLELTAYDRDMLKDDFLGRASILIRDLLRERGRQDIQLHQKENPRALAGWVTVDATGDGFGDFKDIKDSKAGMAVGGHPRHEEHARFRLTILNVRDLGGSKASSKADPYLVMKIGNRHKKKTSVKKNAGGSVQFNETFEFDVHPVDALELTAWDSDMLKDDFLGRTSIQLKDLLRGGGRHELQLRHKNTQELAGRVMVEAFGEGFEDCKDCLPGQGVEQGVGQGTPQVESTQCQQGVCQGRDCPPECRGDCQQGQWGQRGELDRGIHGQKAPGMGGGMDRMGAGGVCGVGSGGMDRMGGGGMDKMGGMDRMGGVGSGGMDRAGAAGGVDKLGGGDRMGPHHSGYGGEGSAFKSDIDRHDIGGQRTLQDQPARTGGDMGRQIGVGDSASRDRAGFR